MAIRRSRRSTYRSRLESKRHQAKHRTAVSREMQLESLEDRRMLAGPQLIGIQPNDGALLRDQDVRSVAPLDLTFRFDETQGISALSLGNSSTIGGIQITRSGSDGEFAPATATSDLNTNNAVRIEFSAVRLGQEQNGIRLVFTKTDHGSRDLPNVSVSGKSVFINMNTNLGNETTAQDLVDAINADPDARDLLTAVVTAGDPLTNVVAPAINYSPLVLSGANDSVIYPGFIGLGESTHEVIVRFAERLPDDHYRIEVFGSGPTVLRDAIGQPFNDGQDLQLSFELDLASQIVAAVPQPMLRQANGDLTQARDTILVYFNDDDLDVSLAENPEFYQLIFTADTVENLDDVPFLPDTVTYDADADMAVLQFSAPLEELATGPGTYRLRIGTDEAAPLAPRLDTPQSQITSDLNTGGLVRVNFLAVAEVYGKATRVAVSARDQGGPGLPVVNVLDNVVFVELNSNSTNESTALDLVNAINGHFRASQLLIAQIVSGDPLTDVATPDKDYSPLQLLGLGSSFDTATDLTDLFDTGPVLLITEDGSAFADGQYLLIGDDQGVMHRFEFDNTGVTQDPAARPIPFTPLSSQTDIINSLAGAINGANIGVTATVNGNRISLSGDVGVRLDGAITGITLTTQGLIVSSQIEAQVYKLNFPGANNEPGHRDIDSKHFADDSFDTDAGITTIPYNFRSDIGMAPDSQGVLQPKFNEITELQKARAREIFEFLGDMTGVQFYESATEGYVIATGDLRIFGVPGPVNAPGAPLGLAGPDFVNARPTVVLDSQDFSGDDDRFGDTWFQEAMRQIITLLGLGATFDLPPLTVMGNDDMGDVGLDGLVDDLTGLPYQNGWELDNDVEPIFPGDQDLVHLDHTYRPESKDIDIYRFSIDIEAGEKGIFTAETIAERLRDSSMLDTVLTVFRENGDGSRELIARNDDYYSNDSYIELELGPGVYYVGVSAGGNEEYDPVIEDSGIGGVTQGKYDLRFNFRPDAENIIRDDPVDLIVTGKGINFVDGQLLTVEDIQGAQVSFEFDSNGHSESGGDFLLPFNSVTSSFAMTAALAEAINASALDLEAHGFGNRIRFNTEATIQLSTGFVGVQTDVSGVQFDGDADGLPGGVYDFWLRAQPTQRVLELVGDGNTVRDGSTITIQDGEGISRRFEFNSVGGVQFGSIPVAYSAASTAEEIAQELKTQINFANFDVDAVQDPSAPARIFLTGDRAVTESANLVGVEIGGKTIFVDKFKNPTLNLNVPPGANVDGGLNTPFYTIKSAFQYARPGDAVRIVGNPGADGDILTLDDNLAYQIGFDTLNNPLPDGATMEAPRGVTVMVDQHAVLQLRRARIGVGSSSPSVDRSASALQVLGAPRLLDGNGQVMRDANGNELPASVYFTSYNDEAVGLDTNPFEATVPRPGDWGGIVFRDDVDRSAGNFLYQDEGIFLNYVNHADIRYGGGQVNISSDVQVIAPIHITDTRPTITHNHIQLSADSAISASPNSFEESNFHATRHQLAPFTSDYDRVGPEIHGNVLDNNTINGLFVRIDTAAGEDLERLTVSARFDDQDIVHVIGENLIINGAPGGSFDEQSPPPVNLVTHTAALGGALEAGIYNYRITFLDAYGQEGMPSNIIANTTVAGAAAGQGSIVLGNLPTVNRDFVARRIYRSANTGEGPFVLVAQLNGSVTTYVDDGTTRGGLLNSPSVGNTTLTPLLGGALQDGQYRYKIVFVDQFGNEGIPSPATLARNVSGNPDAQGNVGTATIQLDNLPVAGAGYVARRLYRSASNGQGPYVLVANLDTTSTTFIDFGAVLDPDQLLHEVYRARQDARLKVDPALVVKLDGARVESGVGGQFIAEGRDGLEVTFTSLLDDRFGAGTFDTSDDGPPVAGVNAPQAGDWAGLYMGHLSSVNIDHALFAFGGGVSRIEGTFVGFNTLEIHQAEARVAHSVFEFNAGGLGGQGQVDRIGRGFNEPGVIFVRGAQPVILGNTIRSNNGPAISINANALNHQLVRDSGRTTGEIDRLEGNRGNQGPLILQNALGGNSINGMVVRGQTLTTETVWDDTSIVHVVLDTIYVPDFHTFTGLRLESSPNESLVVKFQDQDPLGLDPDVPNFAGFWSSGRPLEIDDRIGGILQIVGQPGQPVVLTSIADDTEGAGFRPDGDPQTDTNNDAFQSIPVPGDWRGIRLDKYSHDRNVDVLSESEPHDVNSPGSNSNPDDAQFLGLLAPSEKAGDENLRLGFTVHGFLNDAKDVDVYSFNAAAGTEVWFDVDSTTHALDAVLELIDANGVVLARSDNSPAEAEGRESLYSSNDTKVYTMQKSQPFNGEDFYTTNPRDPGFRVILPGALGTNNTFHIRLRGSSPDLDDLAGGLTSGSYELQIRLQETDELAGSVVRYADIGFATNGIEVRGLPTHSPLMGEYAEPDELIVPNETFAQALQLGNLLATDRGALSVAGNILTFDDVDWYTFDVTVEEAGGTGYEAVFDLDYAEGTGRVNAQISVFDATGNLILTSRSSNVAEDRSAPNAGANSSDLNRGSATTQDPFIGPVSLPAGSYFVAVSSDAMMPAQLAANPMLRLEPVNSVNRVAEDHLEPPGTLSTFQPPTLLSQFEDPINNLFNFDSPVEFSLSDVVLYVAQDWDIVAPFYDETRILTVNPFTGAVETVVNPFAGGGLNSFNRDIGDLSFRSDGNLFAFSLDLEDGFQNRRDIDAGNFLQIDHSNGTIQNLGDDGIITYEQDPASPPPGTPVRGNFASGRQGYGVHFQAMDFGFVNGYTGERLLAAGNRGDLSLGVDNGVAAKQNILYQFDTQTGVAYPNAGTATLFEGDRFPPELGQAATDAVEVGQILTSARLAAPFDGATMIEPLGTISTALVRDNGLTTFQVFDGLGTTVFEFDAGPEIQQLVVQQPNGQFIPNNTIRDGNFFTLDPNRGVAGDETIFQLDTGVVIVVGGNSASIPDGQTLTVNGGGFSTTLEFDNDQTINNGNNLPVDIGGFVDANGIAGFIATAINSGEVASSGGVIARVVGNRVTLENETTASLGPSPGGGALSLGLSLFGDGGSAPILQAVDATQLVDGQEIRFTFDNGRPDVVIEMNSAALGNGQQIPGSVLLTFNVTDTADDIAVKLENAITASNQINGRILTAQLVGDRVVINGQGLNFSTNTTIIDLTDPGFAGALQTFQIVVEESFTNDQISMTVADAINLQTATPFVVGAEGTRINFPALGKGPTLIVTPVEDADFRGVPVWVDQQSETGVAPGSEAIPFFVEDDSVVLAQRMTAAINQALNPDVIATQQRDNVFLNRGAVSATPPLTADGSGPGGLVTGLTILNGEIYVVSDAGGLYHLQADLRGLPAPARLQTTYIQTSAADLVGIEFAGLTAGPVNVENGRYANLLFGIDIDGRMYAFDTDGVLQPIFEGGNTSAQIYQVPPTDPNDPTTGIPLTDIQGFEFAQLDQNLWKLVASGPVPDPCRSFQDGHGQTITYDNTRPQPPFELAGQVSYHFGTACAGTTYDYAGGAYGSLVSNDFSLATYSALDRPTLYFNYYGEIDTGGLGLDSVRVFITDNGGNWTGLVGGFAVNTGDFRQVRVPLDGFAGRENLRLRIDFSTAGEMNLGDPYITGEELRAPRGVYLNDGDVFTITELDLTQPLNFEIESGFTLQSPSGGAISSGERFVIDDGLNPPVAFQFDDDNTFSANLVTVGGAQLTDGENFRLDFPQPDGSVDQAFFELESGYVLQVPQDGSLIADAESFTIDDGSGARPTVFEFDKNGNATGGQVINVANNLTLQVPAEGSGFNGINDANRFIVSNGTRSVVFEFDKQNSTIPGTHVINIRDHLTLRVPLQGGGFNGVGDGETFSLNDGQGGPDVVFEFDSDGNSDPASDFVIDLDFFNTQDVLADRVASAITNSFLGLVAENRGSGLVVITGVTPSYTLNAGNTILAQGVLPINQNETANLIAQAINDEALGVVAVNRGVGLIELENTTPADRVISTGTPRMSSGSVPRTQDEIADRIVNAILAANLGLNPTNLGDGIVHVGGSPNHVLDTANVANVILSGQPGLLDLNAIPVDFLPTDTAEEVAQAIADQINANGLPVTATALGNVVQMAGANFAFSPGNTLFLPEGFVPIFVADEMAASDVILGINEAVQAQVLAGNLNIVTYFNNHPNLDAYRINLNGAVEVTLQPAPGEATNNLLLDGEFGLNTGSPPNTFLVEVNPSMTRIEVADAVDATLERAYQEPTLIADLSGVFNDGDSFTLNDGVNPTVTFEFDSGFILQIPIDGGQSTPTGGNPNPNGIQDGDTFTLTDGFNTITFEYDKDGAFVDQNGDGTPDNTLISIRETSSQLSVTKVTFTAIQTHPLAVAMGIDGALALSNGGVQLGGIAGQTLTISPGSTLTLRNSAPGVRPPITMEVAQTLTMQLPDFLALHVPQGGFVDGETFSISDQVIPPVVFEFEDTALANGLIDPSHVAILFNDLDTQDTIADRIATAIDGSTLGIDATNLGGGSVHVGGGPNHQVDTSRSHLTHSGVGGAVLDGEVLVVGDGMTSVFFEFDDDGLVTPGRVAVDFTFASTPDQIAAEIVTELQNSGLGLLPADLGGGDIHVGAASNHLLNTAMSGLTQVGIPGPIQDGETFTLTDGLTTVVFEFDADGALNDPTNTAVVFDERMSLDELGNAIVAPMLLANLGVFPTYLGGGLIDLGGQPNNVVDTTATVNLTTTGVPGGSVPIFPVFFSPSVGVSAAAMAQTVAGAINAANQNNQLNIQATLDPFDQRRITLTHTSGLPTDVRFDGGTSPMTLEGDIDGDGLFDGVDMFKQEEDLIRVFKLFVQDPGPLGYDGPAFDPLFGFPIPSLPGDIPNPPGGNPGLFGNPFGLLGQTRVGFNSPERGQDNAHEGFYVDDFVIGFAERGEMATSWDHPARTDTTFVRNPAVSVAPPLQTLVGEYQLEIRNGEDYTAGGLLTRGFDTNDRLSQGISMRIQAGAEIAEGQTFVISDGVDNVIFEYDDLRSDNGVQQGHIAIPFNTYEADYEVAQTVRDVINGDDVQNVLNVVAAIADGAAQGPGAPTLSTNSVVDLFGPVSLLTHAVDVKETNDTIADATPTTIDGRNSTPFLASGFIGDNPNFPLKIGFDVDIFEVTLNAGESLRIDVDAQEIGSELDPVLAVFDRFGNIMICPTSATGLCVSDDDPANDELGALDPFLQFTAPANGNYYVGVSSYPAFPSTPLVIDPPIIPTLPFDPGYDPNVEGSLLYEGETGFYQLELTFGAVTVTDVEVYDDVGDQNRHRDQGQILLFGNTISNSAEFGVRIDAGDRTGPGGLSHPGAVRNTPELNAARLAPGVVVANNLIYAGGQGGIFFSGETNLLTDSPAAVPFGRIFNNTLVGQGGTLPGLPNLLFDVGILVEENASPTLLNNIVANFFQGVSVDFSSSTTVVGGMLYQGNFFDSDVLVEDFPIYLQNNDPLFVNAASENFYPAPGSSAIDSSVDSLLDRADLVRVRQVLGLSASPILAPDLDVTGQFRVDDPDVEPPRGFGENVFVDRGAIDRSDFVGPTLSLIDPRDNDTDGVDLNSALTVVSLDGGTALTSFRIELRDGVAPADPRDGVGVDDATVTVDTVEITQNGVPLVEGIDYTFSYNGTSDTIVLTPLSGIWTPDKIYVVTLNNRDRWEISAPGGELLTDGDVFRIVDLQGESRLFEFEAGYTIRVPETYAIQVPQQAGGIGGIRDGDTITVGDGLRNIRFEFDSNNSLNNGLNTPILFNSQSDCNDIAQSITDTLNDTSLGLNSVNLGGCRVHLGSQSNHTLNTAGTPALRQFGIAGGMEDGDVFTIDDGTKITVFEFDSDGVFADVNGDTLPDNYLITFSTANTHLEIAAEITDVVANAPVGLDPTDLLNGGVHLGGTELHVMDTSLSHLSQVGQPGVFPEFGIGIPTLAGQPFGITDGQVFTITNGLNQVTFELDTDSFVTLPNRQVFFNVGASVDEIADSIVSAIQNENLDLDPINQGDGVVTLGGASTHLLTIPPSTNLVQRGAPGQPAAIPIVFTPFATFDGSQVAVQMIHAINSSPLEGVTAAAGENNRVVVEGAASVQSLTGNFAPNFIGAIRDLAANELKPNQFSGETKVSILIGEVDMDFGDAPDPSLPTRFGSNGAIHVIANDLFLGNSVDPELNGQPTAAANGDDLNGDDEDGIVITGIINPFVVTPLTVTASADALLDAWIDYNRDGDFNDANEQIFASQFLVPGENSLSFQAPEGIDLDTTTIARFRLSSQGGLLPTGLTRDGEVEDYLVTLSSGSPPVAVNDPTFAGQYRTDEDTPLNDPALNLLTNDTDADLDPLSVIGYQAVTGLGAAVVVNPDGTFVYDPRTSSALQILAPGETRQDTFTYTISDGENGQDSATVTIRVSGVNDGPTAVDDAFTVQEDQGVAISDLKVNDSDPEGDPLFLIAVDGSNTIGTVSLINNLVTYVQDGQFNYLSVGQTATDTFTYTLSDGTGATGTATVTITITGLNDNPTAIPDTAATDEDTAVNINVTGNDFDPDTGDLLLPVLFDGSGALGLVGPINADLTITYDPNGAFDSLPVGATATDTFSYTMSDNEGGRSTSTVTVTITGANDAPQGVDDDQGDGAKTDENTPVVIQVLANDLDIDGDQLTVVGVDLTGTAGTAAVLDPGFLNNAVLYDPNGQFGFLEIGQTATDSFRYILQDEHGATSTATVVVTVTGENFAPIAVDDTAETNEDTAITTPIRVLDNDSDVEGHPLRVINAVAVHGAANPAPFGRNNNGVVYDPRGEFDQLRVGETATDTITYTVSDTFGATSTATVTVTIQGVNDAPVAVPDTYTVLIGGVLRANDANGSDPDVADGVLANDFDPESDTLTAQLVFGPSLNEGSFTLNPDGTFTYRHAGTTVGADSFTYQVSDGTLVRTAVVTIEVISSVWQNPTDNLDVNGSGEVSPLDALIVINYINQNGVGASAPLPEPPNQPPPYYDVDGDGIVAPRDVLMVIEFLNAQASQGSGESDAALLASVDAGEAVADPPGEAEDQQAVVSRQTPVGVLRADIRTGRAISELMDERNDPASLDELLDELVGLPNRLGIADAVDELFRG